MKWYYQHRNKMFGPLEQSFLVDLFMMGEIDSTTLCCVEDSLEWKPMMSFLELKNALKTSYIYFKTIPTDCILLTKKQSQWLQEGPFHYNEICQMLKSRSITSMDRIWVEGFTSWVPLFKISNFSPDVLSLDSSSQDDFANVLELP